MDDINIYNPLEQYESVYRDKFKEVAERTFQELADAAKVDEAANKQLCNKIYHAEDELALTNDSLQQWSIFRALLWIVAVGGAIAGGIMMGNGAQPEIAIALFMCAVASLIAIFTWVNPKVSLLKAAAEDQEAVVNQMKAEAWQQMEPLNRLYDWDILTRMMSATVPRLEFDPFFTTQRLADLRNTYNWDDSFNLERSVLFSHSGLINGNPFVICRTRKMVMSARTYTGSKTISWTTRERGADGKYYTQYHSETLYASVTKPFPTYPEVTRLIYGNTAAPDLIFNREPSGLAGREKSISFKWNEMKLKRKARNLESNDFAMMTNTEFEVAFNTSNRNNNQQYALLFTPLAQESMLDLLRDNTVGYGDDFSFDKERMINCITANHMQMLELDMNPNIYKNFDFEMARQKFYQINSEYFRAIYFCLAPLLCVPMYQQIRPASAIYGTDMASRSSFWEHEALANFWGQEQFMHPECATNCILKTSENRQPDGTDNISVTAYGYRVEERISYIEKRGGDGRYHRIPVEWDDYQPVTGQGSFRMKEDLNGTAPQLGQIERMTYCCSKASQLGANAIFRRHIASRL